MQLQANVCNSHLSFFSYDDYTKYRSALLTDGVTLKYKCKFNVFYIAGVSPQQNQFILDNEQDGNLLIFAEQSGLYLTKLHTSGRGSTKNTTLAQLVANVPYYIDDNTIIDIDNTTWVADPAARIDVSRLSTAKLEMFYTQIASLFVNTSINMVITQSDTTNLISDPVTTPNLCATLQGRINAGVQGEKFILRNCIIVQNSTISATEIMVQSMTFRDMQFFGSLTKVNKIMTKPNLKVFSSTGQDTVGPTQFTQINRLDEHYIGYPVNALRFVDIAFAETYQIKLP